MIIAGYDQRHGGQVYSIPLGGSLHKQSYAIGGSGSTYIYGYCDANWKEGMSEAEAVAFVKGALREAIKWDGSSGGVIRMVVLTAKGAVRHLYLPDNGVLWAKGPNSTIHFTFLSEFLERLLGQKRWDLHLLISHDQNRIDQCRTIIL